MIGPWHVPLPFPPHRCLLTGSEPGWVAAQLLALVLLLTGTLFPARRFHRQIFLSVDVPPDVELAHVVVDILSE